MDSAVRGKDMWYVVWGVLGFLGLLLILLIWFLWQRQKDQKRKDEEAIWDAAHQGEKWALKKLLETGKI